MGFLCFSLSNTPHLFQVEINHPREIDEIFDAISYEKGASVIRMLQSYIGAECFQVGTLFWHSCFLIMIKSVHFFCDDACIMTIFMRSIWLVFGSFCSTFMFWSGMINPLGDETNHVHIVLGFFPHVFIIKVFFLSFSWNETCVLKQEHELQVISDDNI